MILVEAQVLRLEDWDLTTLASQVNWSGYGNSQVHTNAGLIARVCEQRLRANDNSNQHRLGRWFVRPLKEKFELQLNCPDLPHADSCDVWASA